ncbi:outer membrane lipoprotein-sorting protein [Geothermobacter ehrlichii]|uniref:Outer membrane lipoprotein-sorting protein n=2 Tax=Geothermobacter ehrlichii TaxID=213224 RepID=A0A5D3WKQ1_9BACT|nr:outer membrane lipoprotein-sorting protein [Geothermobacter ehrlichii]
MDMRQLIREVEDQYMGVSSEAIMVMQVRTAHWTRTTEMHAWSLGRDHFLVRILAPAKERDVATLKIGREVWNYLPKVDRTIRIPPSMMGGSWMGSHITNNDLVKAAHIDEDYDFRLLAEDAQTWTIEGLPKPNAAVIWGRIVYRVEKKRRVPVQIDYFDEEGVRVRSIGFDRVTKIGNRQIPLRMRVQPLDQPDEQTVLEYRKLRFDVDIDRTFFSRRQLRMP